MVNNVIGRIASLIGIPLYIDQATASSERLAYARCFVEISSKDKLPNSVKMDLGNREWLETNVEYEWVPPKCSKCFNFGHVDYQCPIVLVEKWVPKATSKETNMNKDAEIDLNAVSRDLTSNSPIGTSVAANSGILSATPGSVVPGPIADTLEDDTDANTLKADMPGDVAANSGSSDKEKIFNSANTSESLAPTPGCHIGYDLIGNIVTGQIAANTSSTTSTGLNATIPNTDMLPTDSLETLVEPEFAVSDTTDTLVADDPKLVPPNMNSDNCNKDEVVIEELNTDVDENMVFSSEHKMH